MKGVWEISVESHGGSVHKLRLLTVLLWLGTDAGPRGSPRTVSGHLPNVTGWLQAPHCRTRVSAALILSVCAALGCGLSRWYSFPK